MVTAHLDRVGARLTGGEVVRAGRTQRRTWIGERVVATVVATDAVGAAGNPAREAQLADVLRRRGVRTPEPLEVGSDGDAQWVLWQRVAGEELRGPWLGDPRLNAAMRDTVAAVADAVAAGGLPDIADGDRWLPAWVPPSTVAAVEERVGVDLGGILDTVVGHRAHQDLHPGNLVVGPRGELWVIDFERFGPAAGTDPHACELAHIASAAIRGGWDRHVGQWCATSPEAGLDDPHVRAVAANLVARLGGHLVDGTGAAGRSAGFGWLRAAAQSTSYAST
jgi:hypothetical protein